MFASMLVVVVIVSVLGGFWVGFTVRGMIDAE